MGDRDEDVCVGVLVEDVEEGVDIGRCIGWEVNVGLRGGEVIFFYNK